MNRSIAIILSCILFVGCSNGNDSISEIVDEDATPSNGDTTTSDLSNTNEQTYLIPSEFPVVDRISFHRQSTGDLISLTDKSLWQITGRFSTSLDVTSTHDITIYADSGDFPQPTTGVKSDYYLYIDGSSVGFYINPIVGLEIVSTNILSFHRESIGDSVALYDDSLWQITGEHRSGYDITNSSSPHNAVVYTNTQRLSGLSSTGNRSDHYLHVSGHTAGFFINPLEQAEFVRKDTISFNREDTGNQLVLSDNTLWQIVGTHGSGYDVTREHKVYLYTNTLGLTISYSGRQSNHFLHISGSTRGFYLEQLN